MILAADVGGTKTNVGLFELSPGGPPRRVAGATYPSKSFPGLEAILEDFLGKLGAKRPAHLEGACFGIAGPVLGNRCETPNLPWVVEGDSIARRFGIVFALLINDLVATAVHATALSPAELVTLNAGAPPSIPSPRALIAAGTGLGISLVVPSGGALVPLPSEGGHADFAPRNDDEIALLGYLQKRHGRVSIERVVCGAGLGQIFDFLAESGRAGPPSPELAAAVAREPADKPRLVSQHALAGSCTVSSRALELFVSAYGAAAGNVALTLLATGGVFIGGGIAPKILSALQSGPFMDAFLSKGRFRGLMEKVPVYVITDPESALLGAAQRAANELERR